MADHLNCIFIRKTYLLFMSLQVCSIMNSNAFTRPFLTQPCQDHQRDFCQIRIIGLVSLVFMDLFLICLLIAVFLSIRSSSKRESSSKVEENREVPNGENSIHLLFVGRISRSVFVPFVRKVFSGARVKRIVDT